MKFVIDPSILIMKGTCVISLMSKWLVIRWFASFHLQVVSTLNLIQCHSSSLIYQCRTCILNWDIRIGMDSKYIKKCIFIFHLLGQNSYAESRASKVSAWLQHIPRTFYVLYTFALILRHYLVEGYQEKPEALVLHLILGLAFVINALVFLEYFSVPNGVRSLNFAYKEAIDYLERQIHIEIDYAPFKRTFQCRVQIFLWTFLATLALKMIFTINGDARHIEMMIVFFYYLKHFVCMHIAFHIEFVRFLMQTINREFDPSSNQHEYLIKMTQPKTCKVLQTLHHLKSIHFRVWKTVQVLNIRFGWILIALMLATILDISYSSYWMWVFIHNTCDEHINLFMRKYSIFFVFRFN